jgi:hypothetical protein
VLTSRPYLSIGISPLGGSGTACCAVGRAIRGGRTHCEPRAGEAACAHVCRAHWSWQVIDGTHDASPPFSSVLLFGAFTWSSALHVNYMASSSHTLSHHPCAKKAGRIADSIFKPRINAGETMKQLVQAGSWNPRRLLGSTNTLFISAVDFRDRTYCVKSLPLGSWCLLACSASLPSFSYVCVCVCVCVLGGAVGLSVGVG